MKLTTIEVRGVEYEVHINEKGKFFADYGGGQIDASSLEELTQKLQRVSKAVKISVPFVQWKDGKIRHAVCTGKHATNRNYMVKWEGAKGVEQMASWDLTNCVDPAFADEYERLSEIADAAVARRGEFVEAHKINVRELADAELAKAQAA